RTTKAMPDEFQPLMDFPPTRRTARILLAVGVLALTINFVMLAVAERYYRILFLLGPFALRYS
ncbi:MAG TPA: hypothetical protein VEL76_33310, partial [Gemmataceae bacterium]|nr:hypothetical protein [Gemmataceae bacterium]